ncbi:MAG: CBS domain-containing protein, partial [Terracidiphilus sp.]
MTNLDAVIFSPAASIRDAVKALDAAGTGALALCDEQGKLVGMLSDGDLRRALLHGHPLEDACVAIACTKPIIASSPASAAYALQLMNEFDIHQLPVVDDRGVLVDFLLRKEVVEEYPLEVESRDRLRKVCIAPEASISD